MWVTLRGPLTEYCNHFYLVAHVSLDASVLSVIDCPGQVICEHSSSLMQCVISSCTWKRKAGRTGTCTGPGRSPMWGMQCAG